MDSTPNDSNNFDKTREQLEESFQPTWHKALNNLRSHAADVVKTWELESEQESAMWAQADELGLGGQVTKETIQDFLNSARHDALDDTHWTQGQDWKVSTDFTWIWDGWIVEGFFHVVTALPKVGKSTLLLALFAELGKRSQSFLNFSISIEKKYEIFLVGPDMNRNLWDKAGRESGLLEHIALGESKWQAIVQDVWAEEDRVGLTPEFIKTLTTKAKQSVARGAHPIFFFDSYKKLLFFAGDDSDTGSSKFAKRLNLLRDGMTSVGKETGVTPTSIVLNHASLSSSKRSASLSAGGDQTFMGIPDQCITLNWLTGTDQAIRKDARVVITAEGRSGRRMPAHLIEQIDAGVWADQGEAGDAETLAQALNERDRLSLEHGVVFDIISGRTRNNQPTTSLQIADIHSTQSNGKSNWSSSKYWRILQALKRKSLVFEDGTVGAVGPMGGTAPIAYFTFERELALEKPNLGPSHTNADSANSAYTGVYARGVVPCYPIGAIVTVKGGGVGKWKVIEANLASGMHVLESSNTGLQKRDLRMLDLQLFIDPDEEL